MKKFLLVLAAALTSAAMAFAQDYSEVEATYNKGAEAMENDNLELALALFQEAYTMGEDNEECNEIVLICKGQIPTIAYNLAIREYNAGNFEACAEKAATAIELAEKFEDAEKQAEATTLLAEAKYNAAKALEDTDVAAAKEAFKALAAAGEERANGRLGFLTLSEASDLQKEAAAQTDPAAKKAAYQKVYDAAKESLGYEENPSAFKILATAARNIDNWEEAVGAYEKYLELKPEAKDAATITNNIAMCYEKLGDKAKALENYKKLAESSNEKLKAKALKKIESLSK